jgi:ABC-type lipoprotein export system ATPase subunit
VTTADSSEVVVRCENLSKWFETKLDRVWAVRNVNLTIKRGEFVALLGASGSGKSTLLSLLSGLSPCSEGSVIVDGWIVGELSESQKTTMRRKTVGVVFQAHNLIEELTAAENVALPLEASGVQTRDAIGEATDTLDRVGLDGFGGRFPYELSGGQQQRVGIARALVGGRTLLLADEPTGALDSTNTEALFKLLRTACDGGTTCLIATHDESIRNWVDRCLQITDGNVSETTRPT